MFQWALEDTVDVGLLDELDVFHDPCAANKRS